MSDDDFDWDDYMDGRCVIALSDAMWLFSEQCPEDGTDPRRIQDWWYLIEHLNYHVELICQFCRWGEGVALSHVIEEHLRTRSDRAASGDGLLPESWWNDLLSRCFDLAKAAVARWPKPPPDDDEDEDE